MYSISYRKKKVIGTDDRGEETLLLDLSNVYYNLSGIPLRIGEREIIWEEISGRSGAYRSLFGSEERVSAMLVLDILMAGKLISTPKPVLAALIDAGEKEISAVSDFIGRINPENAALDIRSNGRNDIFKEQGFDIVVIFADDSRAEEQLRTAYLFLAETGLLLMIAENTRYFKCAAELFISELKEIHIDTEMSVFYAEGRRAFREGMGKPRLIDEFKRICDKTTNVINADGVYSDGISAEICRDINEIVSEAQKQWDLNMKQELLDLKEAFQMYMLNRDDRYGEEYLKELKRRLNPV